MKIAGNVISKIGSAIPKLALTIGLNTSNKHVFGGFTSQKYLQKLKSSEKNVNDFLLKKGKDPR